MCEMMKIMQENREVTCCMGSSANFRNSRLFLQSDVRSVFQWIGFYTEVNVRHPAMDFLSWLNHFWNILSIKDNFIQG